MSPENSFIFRLANSSGMPVEIPDSFGCLTRALHVDGNRYVSSTACGITLLRDRESATHIDCGPRKNILWRASDSFFRPSANIIEFVICETVDAIKFTLFLLSRLLKTAIAPFAETSVTIRVDLSIEDSVKVWFLRLLKDMAFDPRRRHTEYGEPRMFVSRNRNTVEVLS